MVMGVEIEGNGKDEWVDIRDDEGYMNLTVEEMLNRIREAGMCGMGGAGFPTHVKLQPPIDRPIDTVIVNGAECEPYLTADCRLMLEEPEELINGLKIVMKILGAKKGIIAIEDNKPMSIKQLRKMVRKEPDIRVDALKMKYPQGAEKQLVYACTKRKVPTRGGLPSTVGCMVDNVATIINIYMAVRFKQPLIERVVTVTGKILKKPSNFLARLGTKISDLIDYCEGTTKPIAKVIIGGPMMGYAINNLDAPVTKTTSGIVLLDESEAYFAEEHTCLRCGRCVDVCPSYLMPSFIATAVKYRDFNEAIRAGVKDCMKCGCCTYVCPAHIRIGQWIEIGKMAVGK
jgi:electron transport complex protein RnfC